MVWKRANSEEQKEQRRNALLEAAARLHQTRGIDKVSLNAIAREANISKANVYRYFESREELFLQLTLDALLRWRDSIVRRLSAAAGSQDTRVLAQAFALSTIEHPRFARLAAVLATVLERNVSTDAVVRFKLTFLEAIEPLLAAIVAVFPRWSTDDAQHLLQHAYFCIVGMWPAGHPAPAVAEALQRPELASMRIDFEPDFIRALTTVIDGINAGIEASSTRAAQ